MRISMSDVVMCSMRAPCIFDKVCAHCWMKRCVAHVVGRFEKKYNAVRVMHPPHICSRGEENWQERTDEEEQGMRRERRKRRRRERG